MRVLMISLTVYGSDGLQPVAYDQRGFSELLINENKTIIGFLKWKP